jgi:hypothetical protein
MSLLRIIAANWHRVLTIGFHAIATVGERLKAPAAAGGGGTRSNEFLSLITTRPAN